MTLENAVGPAEALEPPLLHCTICLKDKEPEDFYSSARGNETGQCKECIKNRQKGRGAGQQRPTRAKPKPRPRPAPAGLDPARLMEAMTGPDARLELVSKILEMQQETIRLLVGGKK